MEMLGASSLLVPAIKLLMTTLQECVDISSRIMANMANKRKISENECVHLLELSKMHTTLSLASIRAGKFAIEKFITELNNSNIDNHTNQCVDDIRHNLLMIEARLDGCKTIGINSNDTLLIYECAIHLLSDHFLLLKQLGSDHCLPPLTSVEKVYRDFEKLRPKVYDKAIISLKSDRNENFLGTPGPNPVYKIGGITELTTEKFGEYAKFKIEKVSFESNGIVESEWNLLGWCEESAENDNKVEQQCCKIWPRDRSML